MHAVTRQHNRGFTLLELMVVVVIAAMLFTFVALTVRTQEPEDAIKEEALRFNRLLQLLQEESILKGEDYAIEIGAREYRFLRLEENKWTPITDDKIMRLRELPRDIELDLSLEQTDIVIKQNTDDKDKISPQIFILSSGEITPEFSLVVYIPTVTTRYIINGYFDGKHTAEFAE